MKNLNLTDLGRSAVEVISVIAVMGLLVLGGGAIFRHIHNKRIVSVLIDEAMMNRTRLELESDKKDVGWFSPSFKTKTNYQIAFRYDIQNNLFMKIPGLEKGVCELLLQEKDLFSFWTEENTAFERCQEENNLVLGVIMMQGNALASVRECIADENCADGYCSDGQCKTCGENKYWDATKGSCQDKCTQNSDCGNSNDVFCGKNGHCMVCTNGQYDASLGGCRPTCDAGEAYNTTKSTCEKVWTDASGVTHFCSQTGNFEATAEECAKCDSSSTPRIFSLDIVYNIYRCGLCSAGKFYQTDTMTCRDCASSATFVSTEAACSACDNTDHPRRMSGGRCCPTGCPAGSFLGADSWCKECSSQWRLGVYGDDEEAKAAECAKCDETDYPRMMFNGKCARISCSAEQFFDSNRECRTCDETTSYIPLGADASEKAAECAKCDNTDNPRLMVNGKCVSTTVECPSGQFKTSAGTCVACTVGGVVPWDENECAKCDTTSTPREMFEGFCIRQDTTCASGKFFAAAFDHSLVACTNCGDGSSFFTSATECAKCDSTSTPRTFLESDHLCSPTCAEGQFLRGNGTCIGCHWQAITTAYSEAACAKCNLTAYPREVKDGNCVLVCKENRILMRSGGCAGCSDNYDFEPYSAEECAKCNLTAYPRHMEDGLCVRGAAECATGEVINPSTNQCEKVWTDASSTEHFCSEVGKFEATSTECAKCDSSSTPRVFAQNQCGLCASGQFYRTDTMVCQPCDLDAGPTSTEAACSACANTDHPRRWISSGSKCAPGDCGQGRFMAYNGNCVNCNTEVRTLPYDANECSVCNYEGSEYPRQMIGEHCTRTWCPLGKFLVSNGDCMDCSASGYNGTYNSYPFDENECAKCDNTEYPRHMEDGRCRLGAAECATGEVINPSTNQCEKVWTDSANAQHFCSEVGKFEATSTECAKCDSSSTPRVFAQNQCGLCASGQFYRTDTMVCQPCNLNAGLVSTGTACSACNLTDSPREMIGDQCALVCSPQTFRRNWTYQYECFNCSDEEAVTPLNAAQCDKCSLTSTPRMMLNGKCVLETCSGGFHEASQGNCHLCSVNEAITPLTENECALCNTTATPRTMVGTKCVRASCAEGYWQTNDGTCVSCDVSAAYVPMTEAECTKCVTAGFDRAMNGGQCILLSCSNTEFLASDGNCHSCSDTIGYVPFGANATEQAAECAKCTGTNARTMVGGKCVKPCALNQYHKADGSCVSCDTRTGMTPLDDAECSACVQHTEHMRMMYGGICYGSGCVVNSFYGQNGACMGCGQIGSAAPESAYQCLFCSAFLNSSNKCELCSKNDAVAATSENCAMCDGTQYPRQMSNGKCVPQCNATTQKVCSNATNIWCCDKDANCGAGDNENSKCTGLKGKKCVYTLSGSTTNMVAVKGTPYECGANEYCFGKWQANGSILSGSYKTTLYGMCLSMGESLDTPAEDAQNPWL